jgi:hypothetical protein
MSKKVALVVKYDTESEAFYVDGAATEAVYSDGNVYPADPEQDLFLDEGLTEAVAATLAAKLGATPAPASRQVPSMDKFIELALNIVDPGCWWDHTKVDDFSDGARRYFDEHAMTSWEIESAFDLAEQFVHDWARVNLVTPSSSSPATADQLEVLTFAPDASLRVNSTKEKEMAKDVSLVVRYDPDTRTFQSDPDQTDAYLPDGPVWNYQTNQAERDYELVSEAWRQLNAKFAEPETPTAQSAREGLVLAHEIDGRPVGHEVEVATSPRLPTPVVINNVDPVSRETQRMVFGFNDGLPMMALFVGDNEEPILIDRATLQMALENGWPELRNPVTTDPTVELFITRALTMVDPDCQWDVEEVLDFSDRARLYLDEHPIVEIEHDGQLTDIVRSFVDEWQDVNSPPIESVYRPNTDSELDVLDAGIDASITAGRVIE